MDKYDIPFLLKNINDEMPLFSDEHAKIKRSFSQGLPKNIKEYADVVNKKFLDNTLATVEDFSLKFPNDDITQWFKEYQNRYFNSVLLKDSFLKIDEDGNFGTMRNYRPMSIQNVGFLGSLTNKVNGATLETTGANLNQPSYNGDIYANKLPNTGVIGQYYDQVAFDWHTASGNERQAIYDDSGGIPVNLKMEIGSFANATGYAWHVGTEFALPTTQMWTATQIDNATSRLFYKIGSAGDTYTKTQAFGAFPNPIVTPSSGALNHNCKIGHS